MSNIQGNGGVLELCPADPSSADSFLLAALHMLSMLLETSRCSSAVHVSSMAAALPLLGALVSSVKAVKLAALRGVGPGIRAEIAYLLSLTSAQTFNLMGGASKRWQVLKREESSSMMAALVKDQKGQQRRQQQGLLKQPGVQPGQTEGLQEQEQQAASRHAEMQQILQRCNTYWWAGLLVFECAVSFVFTLAFAPAMFSFACLADQRVGLGLAAGIAPPFQDQLLGLLQGRGAVDSFKGGGEGEAGRAEGTDERVQTTALVEESRADVAKGAAAGEGRVDENASRPAGEVSGKEGGKVARSTVEAGKGESVSNAGTTTAGGVCEEASSHRMVQSAAEAATVTLEAPPAPLALGIYSCLQAYAKTAGFPVLMAAYESTIRQTGAPVLTPAAIFTKEHAEMWQQVLHDAEQSCAEGGLVMRFHNSVSIFKLACEVLSIQLGFDDASRKLQKFLSDVLCSVQNPWQMVELGDPQELRDITVVGALLPVCNTTFCSRIWRYFSASAASFCCSNPSCMNLAGTSELELLMGGAAGRSGGYCAGCKRVCYCSEACQKEGWEDHREACTKHQQEEWQGAVV
jgi:hypothetical protein